MLTEKDISTIVSRVSEKVATKADIATLGKRLGSVEKGLSGHDLTFIRIEQKIDEVHERLDSLDEKFDRQLVLLDKLIEKVDAMTLEYAAVSTQLSRHEEWIKQLAEKAGLKLAY